MTNNTQLPRAFNAASFFIDRHLDEGRIDKIAYIDDDGRYSYGELAVRVNKIGNGLRELGLAPESRIAMIANDSIDFVATFWGAIKAGFVPVPLNTLLTTAHYDYMLNDCRAPVLVVSNELYSALREVCADQYYLREIVLIGAKIGDERNLNDLINSASAELNAAPTAADDVAFWLYSSGSTGDPKGTKHLHRSLVHTCESFAKGVLDIGENDIIYSAAKLFFAYGLGNAMSFPLAVGATTVLTAERPTPALVMALMQRDQVSLYFGVPTLYAAILADQDLAQSPGSARLRLCVSAGEALPEETGKRWESRFKVPIIDGVGSTEMLHIFLSNRPDDIRYGLSGKAVPGYELKLVNEQGEGVPRGELGELVVKGDSSAEAYWAQVEKSRRTFVGAWTYTGDKYTQDKDGYYRFCGRTDDMFKSGGNWVSPFDVEACLIAHPDVLEAAVVAWPDEHDNVKPKAYVVLRDSGRASGELVAALQDHVRQNLEKWKYPRWIEFRADLPKTATGKIQRFKLR